MKRTTSKNAAEVAAERAEDAFDVAVEGCFLAAIERGGRRDALIGGLAGTTAGLIARELSAEQRAELLEAFCNAFNLKVAL